MKNEKFIGFWEQQEIARKKIDRQFYFMIGVFFVFVIIMLVLGSFGI